MYIQYLNYIQVDLLLILSVKNIDIWNNLSRNGYMQAEKRNCSGKLLHVYSIEYITNE